MKTEWKQVGQAAQFATDLGGCVKVDDLHIAVFNLNNRKDWYAIENRCPHKAADVLSRGIVGDADGEPKVACPLHKRSFSLKSGECISDDEMGGVKAFEIKCEDGVVYLKLPLK